MISLLFWVLNDCSSTTWELGGCPIRFSTSQINTLRRCWYGQFVHLSDLTDYKVATGEYSFGTHVSSSTRDRKEKQSRKKEYWVTSHHTLEAPLCNQLFDILIISSSVGSLHNLNKNFAEHIERAVVLCCFRSWAHLEGLRKFLSNSDSNYLCFALFAEFFAVSTLLRWVWFQLAKSAANPKTVKINLAFRIVQRCSLSKSNSSNMPCLPRLRMRWIDWTCFLWYSHSVTYLQKLQDKSPMCQRHVLRDSISVQIYTNRH